MVLLRAKPRNIEVPMNNGHNAWGAHDGKRQQRALLASATQLSSPNGFNRPEASRLNKLRQPWQEDAWAYRDAIGELRYATTFLGNCHRKIMLIPSAYVQGELDPVPLTEISSCPPNVIAAADDALKRLSSGGPLAMSGLQRDFAENFEVAGECFLVGWPPNTQLPEQNNTEEIWEIRSVSEISANNDGGLQIRMDGTQAIAMPEGVFVQRMWYPHPRRKALADSPFAAMLDACEELLILSRDIRASGRSRLANSGLLLLPDKLTVVKSNPQADAIDQEQDEFMQELIAAGMAAIQDEGSASAIFPIVVRGPMDALGAVRQVQISRPDAENANKRQELITRMATTLDLPAEVLTGKGDLNHWTAWAVSDDTFNDHVEPLVMVMDDAFTAGYLRLVLTQTPGLDPDWVTRVVLWHDATRLVRHPDRSQDALQAHDRMAISNDALRDTMGFGSSDAPNVDELLQRLLIRQNRLDPTIVAQILKKLDNSLDISGVVSALPAGEQGIGGPENDSIGAENPQNPGPPEGGQPGQTQGVPPAPTSPPGLAAVMGDGSKQSIAKGNRSLSKIESNLFDSLMTACNASMTRALEKAGARIRTSVSRTASGRAWCASHSNLQLCFLISNSMRAAAGLDEHLLLNNAWDQLQAEYQQYLDYAGGRTVNTISSMLNMDPDQFTELADQLSRYSDDGWQYLYHQLNQTAMGYLNDPASEIDMGVDIGGDVESIGTTRLVPPGIIKGAIARAGGYLRHAYDAHRFDPTVSVSIPQPGLTTGPAVADTMDKNGLGIESYVWVHGYTPNPFEPHEQLDGVEFTSWTDDVLTNDDEFPDVDYFSPGDHDGCSCDFHVNWSDNSMAAAGRPKALTAYADQPRDEGGKFGEGKENEDTVGGGATVDQAVNAGMARQTAARLDREGKLDDAVTLSETQAPSEDISQAQGTAEDKYNSYSSTISEDDKAAAEERHAASSRAGGDDRPSYATRRGYCTKLVGEYGNGETCPCIYCGRTLNADTVSLDRLVPGSEGGKYVMANLAPTCYDCNNWRGNTAFTDAMSAAKGALAAAAANDKPIVPLGTMVTAQCTGFHAQDNDPSAPTGIPLEEVTGKLDGYYVETFGYFKYIVCGYDVIADTIKIVEDES